MSDKTYDTIKIIALIAVPVSTFILAVLSALQVPNMDVITAIFAAFDTLLGAFVEVARRIYYRELGE